jgi:hypothetical protein
MNFKAAIVVLYIIGLLDCFNMQLPTENTFV